MPSRTARRRFLRAGDVELGAELGELFPRLVVLVDREERRLVEPDDLKLPTASVAEIQILQRLPNLEPAHQLDGGLQIIALLAGDPQLVALDRGLHLEL